MEGFWVSLDYFAGRPFQTLTIRIADTTRLGHIPFEVETNQYGAYPYVSPLDSLKGVFTAYDPHWDIHFTTKINRDTLVQDFPYREPGDRTVKYVKMDTAKIWRETIFCNLLLQLDLPKAGQEDTLTITRKSLVAEIFLGPLKESIRVEHPEIAPDSMALQVNDVLIGADQLARFLYTEQAKQEETDRDSMFVVLNADKHISDIVIDDWVTRINRFNPNLRVWRGCIDFERRKFSYRHLTPRVY